MERQVRGQYTADYKAQAVSLAQTPGATKAARKLGISVKTLANRIRIPRDGAGFVKDGKRRRVSDLEAKVSRLRTENSRAIALNLLQRRFGVDVTVRAGASDITYVATREGREPTRVVSPDTVHVPGVYIPAAKCPALCRETIDQHPPGGQCSSDAADASAHPPVAHSEINRCRPARAGQAPRSHLAKYGRTIMTACTRP